jgi:hypothetical protein
MLVCTGMCLHVLVHSMYWYVLVCACMYLYILVCYSIWKYILVHSSTYSDVWYSNALISSKWIHHSTWQYKEVPKSPVPLNKPKAVHECTRPYTFMYFLVPPYSGVQDFWVLPCTAMYCDVSTCRISRHYSVGNQSMYWYVLVCACMY